MPQASEALRNLIRGYFGNIDCGAPLEYLLKRGFKEKAGCIHPPYEGYELTDFEITCIDFLFEEWDFAYLASGRESQAAWRTSE